MIELVGSSTTGSDDAIANAIACASETLKNLDWFEVAETRGYLADGKIAHYQVGLRIGFRLHYRRLARPLAQRRSEETFRRQAIARVESRA